MAVVEYEDGTITALATDTKPEKTGGWTLYETNTGKRFSRHGGAWIDTTPPGPAPSYTSVMTSTYTCVVGNLVLGVNFAGAVTITLPSVMLVAGQRLVLKDESGLAATNNITIDTQGAELIDGVASQVINTNYGSMGFYSNGTDWFTL